LLVNSVLQHVDFFGWVYGPEFAQHLAQDAVSPERKAEIIRMSVWRSILCLPLYVATVLGVCTLLSGAQPYQLGLTTHRLGRNVLIAVIGLAVAAPLHVLNVYLNLWYQHLVRAPPSRHPLTVIAEQALPIDQVLIVISAVVAAPMMEELLFRGLLQPWFIRLRQGGALAVGFAFSLALFFQIDQLHDAWTNSNWRALALALQPAAFVLLFVPILLLTRRMVRPEVAGGIVGTAVLFAAAHSGVWPSPIPLLPLGLVLGWLAYRTRSLVGPVVLHALFNSIACIEMWYFNVR
jgi:membrane protease YdiL (CAAX protease family)